MIYGVIEEHRYELMKTNHAGNRETYETTKEYKLKFSGNPQACKNMFYEFEQFCEEYDCFWRWNYSEGKMCDNSYLNDEVFHCYCALMSSFLASKGFIPAFSSPILHYYYLDEK